MKAILFIHQAGIAQFKHLASSLISSGTYIVYSLRASRVPVKAPTVSENKDTGIIEISYPFLRGNTSSHLLTKEIDSKLIRADSVYKALQYLLSNSLIQSPDLIWAHPGWGETLFLRQLLPSVPQVHFAEYYYSTTGQDVDSDSLSVDELLKVCVKNLHNCQSAVDCDVMVSPTPWQAATYPKLFQPKVKVIHDGIDIDTVIDNSTLPLDEALSCIPTDNSRPIIVYTNRALEPIRGSSVFAESLPDILDLPERPIVCIVGGQETQNPYGGVNASFNRARARLLDLVASRPLDIYHFPRLPHAALHQLWRISSCNIYLTSPFVLSWSLLEMMCIPVPIVASSTPPVLDFLDKTSSILIDYPSKDALLDGISNCLRLSPSKSTSFARKNLRTVKSKADLHNFTLKEQQKLVEKLIRASHVCL